VITLSSQQLSEKDKVLIPLFTLITRRYLRTVVIRQQLLDFALITGRYLRESPITAVSDFALTSRRHLTRNPTTAVRESHETTVGGRVYTVDEKLLRKVKDLPFVLPTLQSRGTALPLMRANDSLTLISHS
jgi:hypothetical protein